MYKKIKKINIKKNLRNIVKSCKKTFVVYTKLAVNKSDIGFIDFDNYMFYFFSCSMYKTFCATQIFKQHIKVPGGIFSM